MDCSEWLKGYFVKWHDCRRAKWEYEAIKGLEESFLIQTREWEAILAREKARMEKKEEEAEMAYKEISAMIEKAKTPERRAVLSMRYLSLDRYGRFADWKQIAAEIGYSEGYVMKIHRDGLADVAAALLEIGAGCVDDGTTG